MGRYPSPRGEGGRPRLARADGWGEAEPPHPARIALTLILATLPPKGRDGARNRRHSERVRGYDARHSGYSGHT
jgi:hypothetical protein